MKRSVFVAVFLMCFFYANNVLAVDNYAVFKDVEFHLKGDYEAYSKHFNERDINSYNGNRTVDSDGNAAWRPEGTHVQTDERESWLEHELRLYPRVVFNENLEFNMRMDAGDYIFSSDYGNYVADVDDSSIHDNEKLRVEEAFVQMITPVGLFVAGRFEGGNHGIVWGIQLPQLPEWTFAVAWNKKNEERHDYETPTYDYMAPETQQLDYLDRDDQNEFRFVTIYEDKDMGFRSQQWLDLRWGASKSSAKNMRIYLPQWEMEYNKDNLHLFGQFGMGFGTLAELTKMSLATDINELQGQATLLSSELQSRHLSFPSIVVKDLGPEDGKSIVFDAFCIYDIGTISPEVGVGYTTGADHYNQINAFWWDDLNPHGYRTPRRIKTLLIGEVEDKYYPILATLATREAFDQDDVCLQNMTWLKAGATWRFAEKWKLFGQGFAAWRTNTTYFERDYWDM
ncbi:MAG: hypothetical protein U9P80_05925, partial [Thermodesulfobacteriota bacterium]|nr:hypothetical protein [Thermodesulfobacteriota bacterium]